MRLLKEFDRARLKADPYYLKQKGELDRIYGGYRERGMANLKYSDYITFYDSGSRRAYEDCYFSRRACLTACAVFSMLYGDEYIKDLEDVIWAICDEYSWAVPAHTQKDLKEMDYIDLFTAETGLALSEILYLLGDRLEELVRERAKHEIERRVINSFMKRTFFWEDCDNNWGAVCAGSVGATFIYICPERFSEVEGRIGGAMERFLDGFSDEGVCLEGLLYWRYGFGYFVCYAELLREFNGYDYFKRDRVRKIASYQHKAFLQGDAVVSFSDNAMTGTHIAGLTCFLKREYPQDVKMLDMSLRTDYLGDRAFKWAFFIRDLLWSMDAPSGPEPAEDFIFLPSAAQYISRRRRYAFAAKAGKNEEPHNHNDVGSFILAVGGRQVLCDIGAGEYTRQYFSPERYSFICNSSLGHSVPVLDGAGQQFGWRYSGEILKAAPEMLTMEISEAYALPQVSRLERRFDFGEDGLTMTDSYDFSGAPIPIKERLVTLIKPERTEGGIALENVKISCDACSRGAEITAVEYKNHLGELKTLYLIDYAITGCKAIFDIKITEGKVTNEL